ncbi:MAG: S8 family serine peptidase [Candidatus Kapabacteria bacterium]|nr:S8 family serine peptidase [Candidatus Kapabacteria bacterium]
MRYELRIEEDNYAAAIEWMEALGADISTSSLGYYGYDSPDSSYKYENMNGRTSVSAVACNYATRMGMICISAAGNSGGIERTINTPGDADSVFSVGAFANDTVLRPAGFTSKGPTADGRMKPDIAALGEGVTSYRHVSTNEVGRGFTGTSFSTPLIAGAAALLKSAFPELRTYEVRKLMQSYASSFNNPNNAVGFGMPDLLASSLAYGILCSPPLSYPGRNAHQISYRIKSNSPLTSVRLIYRKKGESEWKSKPMLSSPNDYVVARLPHYDIGTTGVLEFYVEFESNHKRGRMPADITSFSTTDIGSTSIPCGIAQADIPTSIEVTVTTTPLTPTVIQSENGVHVWCPPSAREARIYSVSGEIVETIQLLEGHGYLAKQLATGLYFCSAISESQRHTTTFMVVR